MPIHDWTRLHPGLFCDFHLEWNLAIKQALNEGLLPEGHYAVTERTCLLVDWDSFSPQIVVVDNAAVCADAGSGTSPQAAITAVSQAMPLLHGHPRIAIHDSDDEVIAYADIVLPGNKSTQAALRSFVNQILVSLAEDRHLLIIDLYPPGQRDPHGMHAAIWAELDDEDFELPVDKPLTLAAYQVQRTVHAYVKPTAVGQVLIDMPLFLTPDLYVPVPLEWTYQQAFAKFPARWQRFLQPPEG